MAIDFGRMIQGVATGAMGQYNAEVAAKDKMKGNIIERAGLNFYEETLPAFQKKEASRKETYDKLAGQFGVDVAEYFGQNNFITGDANDYKNILTQLGDKPEIKADQLKTYLDATDSSYTKRATKRFDAIKEREKAIMGLTSGDSKIGTMTAQLQIPESTPITETTEEVVTPAVEGTQSGPQVTEAVPEKTEMKTTALPTYEEIFGDITSTKAESVYLKMDSTTKKRYQDMAGKIFDRDKDALTGDFAVAEGYLDDYTAGIEDGTISNKTTQNQYIYNRWFKEQFLPNENISYTTPLPQDIIQASTLINYYNSIGDETMVTEIKKRLKDKGYDLTDYNL